MAFFSNLKISNCGKKGRIVVASRAFVYTNAILLCKMLVGLCPNPICSASCRCRLRVCSKHFYNKKDSLGLFHEGRILGYLHLSGFRFFCAALLLCKEQFYIFLSFHQLLHLVPCLAVVWVCFFLLFQKFSVFDVQVLSLWQLFQSSFIKSSFCSLIFSTCAGL